MTGNAYVMFRDGFGSLQVQIFRMRFRVQRPGGGAMIDRPRSLDAGILHLIVLPIGPTES